MVYVIRNDKLVPREQAVVDIEDRGYQFGDGIYEVIRVYDGIMFLFDEHFDRLRQSANQLQIELLFSKEELQDKLLELIGTNQFENGIVYIQITRGVYSRLPGFPSENIPPELTAYTSEKERPVKELQSGVCARLMEDIRWLRCDIKSINLLPSILARRAANEKGCYEAILHRDSIITEGSFSNVFMVKDETVSTHPVSNLILDGVSRRLAVRLCKSYSIPIVEQPFTIKKLLDADELFITSTLNEIMPVVSVDDKKIGGGKPGPITRRLQELFTAEIENTIGQMKSIGH